MEKKVVDSVVVEKIGEYGIIKTKEGLVWNNGKVFGSNISYDVAIDNGEGDIVASFEKIKDARKWAKDN